ncbi:uncharacterized protein PITG_14592 [Phytophthora infestans T30-4]|uniref:Vacuolar ATPase assembly protein VMA22 n=1 Tax=Phytophthora infestans (strain T30-4) TaxID=403677 RepID=D0NQM4_PHYIT|nr:uncharacterized protein PITG_14592 [Phytophthora infestans T30-4]EEY62972.1 hypothetical protein PITG_14592 [Phytophthora infestans T30-4]|eukprot:XP_002898495.1 hypothetical protein PITG_14592 [Phytophthora infestans T30-4]
MTDGTDKLLVAGLEDLEKYLDDHEVANAKLKQGFLMLTKAKLRLQEHALSEISYHEEFEAFRVVVLDSEGNWRLQDASEVKEEATDTKARNTDTLLWFSSLPPSDLRQAQKQFSSGLQALLVAAASAHKVQRAVHGVTSIPH